MFARLVFLFLLLLPTSLDAGALPPGQRASVASVVRAVTPGVVNIATKRIDSTGSSGETCDPRHSTHNRLTRIGPIHGSEGEHGNRSCMVTAAASCREGSCSRAQCNARSVQRPIR